jgi:hypothetical protein
MSGELEILGATEILGEEELELLMGEDDEYDDEYEDEMLGARRRAMMRRRGGGRARTRTRGVSRAARKPLGVVDKPPTKGRQLVLGFDSVANIAALGVGIINSNPQQIFAPERISVPATVAPNFILTTLTIGTAIQFLNATAVHAETFGSTAPDVTLKMDTAQINSVITMNVTSLSAVALRFFASLIGPSVM